MATINSRNESNKFIKQIGSDFVHKPADEIEDITQELLEVVSDLQFQIFSDENCESFEGEFKVIFKNNDGIYVSLSDIQGVELLADFDYQNNIKVLALNENKLIEWSELEDDSVINLVLKSI